MENKMDFIDVSEEKDKFMIGVYISLAVLAILGLLVYFFGYDIFESFIKV